MNSLRRLYVASMAATSLLMFVALVGADDQEKENDYEHFDASNFDRPINVDNEWFPLKPGTRFVWEGYTVDDEGDEEPHRVVFTVTDMTKVIAGVRTIVCWDIDYEDDEMVETEIVFFAQDNDGTVWQLGEYPEEYEDEEFIAAPCWIHGIQDTKAGIMMQAEPRLGTPSYSQGWAPSVAFTDRGLVYQMGQKTAVHFGTYDNVLVIDESNKEEPHAHQLKYYARGVGNIRVGWRGEGDEESLELIKVEHLNTDELTKAGNEVLKLEARAYEISKDVYTHTIPAQRMSSSTKGK